MVRIVATSDTHLETPVLPEGDIFIHTGDFTFQGMRRNVECVQKAYDWLKRERPKFKHMVGVAGNHDFGFNKTTFSPYMDLLFDEEVELEGLRVYGTPYVPRFYDWAFMENDFYLEKRYAKIPEGLDILLCHGPARGTLDLNINGDLCGSEVMARKLGEMVHPPNHFIFGHIHRCENSPNNHVYKNGINYYNASYMDESYSPENSIIVIDI